MLSSTLLTTVRVTLTLTLALALALTLTLTLTLALALTLTLSGSGATHAHTAHAYTALAPCVHRACTVHALRDPPSPFPPPTRSHLAPTGGPPDRRACAVQVVEGEG